MTKTDYKQKRWENACKIADTERAEEKTVIGAPARERRPTIGKCVAHGLEMIANEAERLLHEQWMPYKSEKDERDIKKAVEYIRQLLKWWDTRHLP